jgi:cytochrome b561
LFGQCRVLFWAVALAFWAQDLAGLLPRMLPSNEKSVTLFPDVHFSGLIATATTRVLRA